MQIISYNNQYKEEWNRIVNASCNGTFLFNRDFMDYHKDRFEDVSLMFVKKNIIKGLLPANINEDAVYSHAGLTYGGIIIPATTSSPEVSEMLTLAIDYYSKHLHASSLYYKPIPYIYHTYPSSQDLYYLTQRGAQLIHRKLSSAILIHQPITFSELRRRHVVKAKKTGLSVSMIEGIDTWRAFWDILSDVLMTKHQRHPVHSLQEILLLKSNFEHEIRLLTVLKENTVIAGTVLFLTSNVIHAQYIASNDAGCESGALDLLFDYILHTELFRHYSYLDFGVSTEKEGQIVNTGLLFQKEGFGGRGICYDEYLLNIS